MSQHLDGFEHTERVPSATHLPVDPRLPLSSSAGSGSSSVSERRQDGRAKPDWIVYVQFAAGNGGIVLDISESGAALQMAGPLDTRGAVRFRFQVPLLGTTDISAETIWLDETHKRCGIQFTDLPEKALEEIRRWLSRTGPTQPARREQPVPRRFLVGLPVEGPMKYQPAPERASSTAVTPDTKPFKKYVEGTAAEFAVAPTHQNTPEQKPSEKMAMRMSSLPIVAEAPAATSEPPLSDPNLSKHSKAIEPSPHPWIVVEPGGNSVALPSSTPARSKTAASSTALHGGVEWVIRPLEAPTTPAPAKPIAAAAPKIADRAPLAVRKKWIAGAAVAAILALLCGISLGHFLAVWNHVTSAPHPDQGPAEPATIKASRQLQTAQIGAFSSAAIAPEADDSTRHGVSSSEAVNLASPAAAASLPAKTLASNPMQKSLPAVAGGAEVELARQYLLDDSQGAKAAATDLLWKAVKQGNADAELELADLYGRGDGVARDCPQALSLLNTVRQKHDPYLSGKVTAELDFIHCN